jgi:hypothetical protein
LKKVLVESFEEGESVSHFLGRMDEVDSNSKPQDTPSSSSSSSGPGNKTKSSNQMLINSVIETTTTSTSTAIPMDMKKDAVIRKHVASCGMQSLLKMLIWDNFIHADLHPGNGIKENNNYKNNTYMICVQQCVER